MTAGRRNLERTLGDFLSFDLPKVWTADSILRHSRLRRLQYGCSLKVSKKRQQVRRSNDLHVARPGCLGALGDGTNKPFPSAEA